VTARLTEIGPGAIDSPGLAGHVAAALALDEGRALSDPQDWNEEERKIVVDASEVGAVQTAV
jgi:hypothetical protein